MNILTLIGIVAIAGYFAGRLSKRIKVPSLIGYMFLGIILGPSALHMFNDEMLADLSFISEIALGFVAFSIGQELSISSLKRLGGGIVAIIFAESFMAFFVVLGLIYALTRDLPMALVFGSMAPASAPAGTVAVIHEYRAKGTLTKALYAVVGFDDGLAIIIFGFASAVAKVLLIGEVSADKISMTASLIESAKEIVFSILLGGGIGLLFCFLVRRVREDRDILAMVFGSILIAIGLSLTLHLSLILTNLMVGFTMVNTRSESLVQKVASKILDVMPLLFILFFCLAGAHLKISALPALGTLGIVYIIGRSVGLIYGARLGAMFGHVEDKIKKYIGLGILSQAGVAIALSLIVKHEFAEIDSDHARYIGVSVITTITATCIFFEIIGPILTKIALEKAGEIPEHNK